VKNTAGNAACEKACRTNSARSDGTTKIRERSTTHPIHEAAEKKCNRCVRRESVKA